MSEQELGRQRCPECGRLMPPAAKFCDECGAAVDPARAEGREADGASTDLTRGQQGYTVEIHLPALDPGAQPQVADLRAELDSVRSRIPGVRVERATRYDGLLFDGIRLFVRVQLEQTVADAQTTVTSAYEQLDGLTLKRLGVGRPSSISGELTE